MKLAFFAPGVGREEQPDSGTDRPRERAGGLQGFAEQARRSGTQVSDVTSQSLIRWSTDEPVGIRFMCGDIHLFPDFRLKTWK